MKDKIVADSPKDVSAVINQAEGIVDSAMDGFHKWHAAANPGIPSRYAAMLGQGTAQKVPPEYAECYQVMRYQHVIGEDETAK
jgi:hypothetical protein